MIIGVDHLKRYCYLWGEFVYRYIYNLLKLKVSFNFLSCEVDHVLTRAASFILLKKSENPQILVVFFDFGYNMW